MMKNNCVRREILLLALVMMLVPAVTADYTGSSLGVSGSGSVTGNVQIEHGTSSYSGELSPGGTYSVTFPVSAPSGANIRLASVYLFWTWSHDGTEGVQPSLKTQVGGASLSPARSYSDRKGSDPYDYPSGTFVYNVAGKVKPGGSLTVTVTNAASSAGVGISGAVLLFAYDGGGSTGARYWVAEGADMLFATGSVTADAATTRTAFANVPAVAPGTTADLISVVPSGNKGKNRLTFNGQAFSGLFAGSPYADLAIATTPVGSLLRTGQNSITLRDEGDYIVPGLFVLRIAGTGATSTASTIQTTGAASSLTTVATSAQTTQGTPAPTNTSTMIPSPEITATATTIKEEETTPGVLPSETTIIPPTIDVNATSTQPVNISTNATTGPTNITPVIITGSPGAMDTFNNSTANVTATTIETTVTPYIVTTEETTVATTEETTTMATTTLTTTTTTVRTTATTPATPVVLGLPPMSAGFQETPTPRMNTSTALDASGQPPTVASAIPGAEILVSLLGSDGALLGFGIVLFGVLVGGGIIVFSAATGAGLASYILKSGKGRATSESTEQRIRRHENEAGEQAPNEWRSRRYENEVGERTPNERRFADE
jgi:hypothetical protein